LTVVALSKSILNGLPSRRKKRGVIFSWRDHLSFEISTVPAT
jgi:hypothetical protein